MTDDISSLDPDEMRELLNRLKEVRQVREDYPDGNPALNYCLQCDEHSLSVRNDAGEYEYLDCSPGHHAHIIEESHTHGGLSEWISCLEYVLQSPQEVEV